MDPFTWTMLGLGVANLGMQGAGMAMGGGGQGGMAAPRPNLPQPIQPSGAYHQPFQMPQTLSMLGPQQQRRPSPLMQNYMNPQMMNYYTGGIR